MAAHIGFAVFDALAPTPKIGWAQFDARASRPSIGWAEMDVRANPNDSHDSLESNDPVGGRARRSTISRALAPQNTPVESASRYHGRSEEQLLLAQLDDEEAVIAFLMEFALA